MAEIGMEDDDDVVVRPAKRRKTNPVTDIFQDEDSQSSDDFELPVQKGMQDSGSTSEVNEESEFNKDDEPLEEDFIATPKDTFITQPDQPWSSPTRIRGARWIKPKSAPVPLESRLQQRPDHAAGETSNHCDVNDFQVDNDIPVDEFDDMDPEMLEALLSSQNHHGLPRQNSDLENEPEEDGSPQRKRKRKLPSSFRQTTLFGTQTTHTRNAATQQRARNWPLANRTEPPTHHEIDREAMKTWIYPTNLGKIRDYQYTIVHKGLYHNLLVALPTGLGKTFIAATVMLNWFNWTKSAQIIFVAPTKPLVAQQVDACFHIAGIPRSKTTLLTGEVQPAIRHEEWQTKRVFFMTPQTLINDLKSGLCDPKRIVLVVVDEAHKAAGNYAYVEVVRSLRRFNQSFRVLALTATPGATVEAVQKVIDGLDISRVEIRTEDSLDIRGFVHSRNIELKVFDNSEELELCLESFGEAVRPVLNKLNSQNAYWSKDPTSLTLFGLKTARDSWAKSEAARHASFGLKGMVQNIFSVLMSLAHNIELLKYHGIGPFFHKMKNFERDSGKGKYAKQILEHEAYRKMMSKIRAWVNNTDFEGHPKLTYLKTVVLNHFMDAGEGTGRSAGRGPSDTRIMVFAHYRDSAEEIVRVLKRHEPMIRPHTFVGQAGTEGSSGMDQKTQLDIIKKFKAGTYNTIVATSIGEEGLDIGEVDLIVCYDCSRSPIRMLQRMGRTGRMRAGNIVLLLMKGKEEGDYYKAKDNYIKMQEKIESGAEFTFHDETSPRIVPKELIPMVDKRVVEIPIENTQPGELMPTRRANAKLKKPPKRFNMPDGVETGFTFLGPGKKNNKKATTQLAAAPKVATDEELAPIPLLSEVVLTSSQIAEHEERYVEITGKEPEYIRQVRFGVFMDRLRRPAPISRVEHSLTSKAMVKTFGHINSPGRDWTRPINARNYPEPDEDDPTKANGLNIGPVKSGKPAAHKNAGKQKPKPSQLNGAGAKIKANYNAGTPSEEQALDPDDYNLSDDFINDEPQGEDHLSSEDEATATQRTDDGVSLNSLSSAFIQMKSQESLPSTQDLLVSNLTANPVPQTKEQTDRPSRRSKRRVIDSDDEGDDQDG